MQGIMTGRLSFHLAKHAVRCSTQSTPGFRVKSCKWRLGQTHKASWSLSILFSMLDWNPQSFLLKQIPLYSPPLPITSFVSTGQGPRGLDIAFAPTANDGSIWILVSWLHHGTLNEVRSHEVIGIIGGTKQLKSSYEGFEKLFRKFNQLWNIVTLGPWTSNLLLHL